MHPVIHLFIHSLLVVLFPPLLLGAINKTKALFAGRTGPPVLQPYYDIIKLLQKGSVFSTTTTWLFRFGPVVGLVTTAIAALTIPLGHTSAPISFTGDLVLFVYVLGLGRFFMLLAALDTGSAFEGMGAAREATYACLAEPILFFGLLMLAKVTDSAEPAGSSLSMVRLMGGSLTGEWGLAGASMLLILASWFIVLLVENSRIPFDDPNTHLELTMIHEVIVLDHSGPALGLIMYGAALKMFVFAALVVRLAVPLDGPSSLFNWAIFVVATLVVAVLVGVVESVMARLRLVLLPNLLVAAGVLSAFGVVLMLTKY